MPIGTFPRKEPVRQSPGALRGARFQQWFSVPSCPLGAQGASTAAQPPTPLTHPWSHAHRSPCGNPPRPSHPTRSCLGRRRMGHGTRPALCEPCRTSGSTMCTNGATWTSSTWRCARCGSTAWSGTWPSTTCCSTSSPRRSSDLAASSRKSSSTTPGSRSVGLLSWSRWRTTVRPAGLGQGSGCLRLPCQGPSIAPWL